MEVIIPLGFLIGFLGVFTFGKPCYYPFPQERWYGLPKDCQCYKFLYIKLWQTLLLSFSASEVVRIAKGLIHMFLQNPFGFFPRFFGFT